MAVFTFSNFQVVIGQWLPLKHMKAICTERDITMESTHISLLTSRESPLVVIIKAEALDLHITCSNKLSRFKGSAPHATRHVLDHVSVVIVGGWRHQGDMGVVGAREL